MCVRSEPVAERLNDLVCPTDSAMGSDTPARKPRGFKCAHATRLSAAGASTPAPLAQARDGCASRDPEVPAVDRTADPQASVRAASARVYIDVQLVSDGGREALAGISADGAAGERPRRSRRASPPATPLLLCPLLYIARKLRCAGAVCHIPTCVAPNSADCDHANARCGQC